MSDLTKLTLDEARERLLSDIIPAQAGTHATDSGRVESCVGARLRGHDDSGLWQ